MRRFKTRCPKCGDRHIAVRYHHATYSCGVSFEHLHLTCTRCRFDFRDAPLDAGKYDEATA